MGFRLAVTSSSAEHLGAGSTFDRPAARDVMTKERDMVWGEVMRLLWFGQKFISGAVVGDLLAD